MTREAKEEALYKGICLLILLLGINCNNNGASAPDLGMGSADLNMASADLNTALADLNTAPADLSMPGSMKQCSTDSWCWENPLPQGNPLSDVWGADANNVWAVGASGTIQKWNGTAWAAQPKWNWTAWAVQSSGILNDLYGVWGTDANNVWAVGTSGAILKVDYESPIGTYTNPPMEMPCQTFSLVMSTFSARRATLHPVMSNPGEPSAMSVYRPTCRQQTGCRSTRRLPRSNSTVRYMV
jgi:hypothetical protein